MRAARITALTALTASALVVAAATARAPGTEPAATTTDAARPVLPAPGRLARVAGQLGSGPRLAAGIRVNRAARVDMAGAPGAARTVLVVGCLERARCAGSALADDALVGCPPTGLDLWTVPGLRGGPTRDGRRALRRLVADARPDVVILFRDRPHRRGAPPGAVAGWVTSALPRTKVVETFLPRVPRGSARDRRLAQLRAAIGLDAHGQGA